MSPQDISEAMVRSYADASAHAAAAALVDVRHPRHRGGRRVARRARSQAGNPMSVDAGAASRAVSTDYYGAFSCEKFAAASDLTYTHDDAQGWLNYVQQFQAANFWYRTRAWRRGPTTRNTTTGRTPTASTRYGRLSLRVTARWTATAYSTPAMGARLGRPRHARRCRRAWRSATNRCGYMFWSTCFSLRVLAGTTPFGAGITRTWASA